MKILISVLVAALSSSILYSAEPYGSQDAVRGGQLNLHTSEFPKSFNYMVNNSSDASAVFNLVYDTLMEIHPVTLEFQPLIAKSWTISKDKKEFTININPEAKWADGKPITAEDVRFTYDVVMNPSNMTSVQRLFLGRFEPPQVVNATTVIFRAKNVHYNNLVTLAGFNVLPKHLMEGKDFNKAFNMSLPGSSGPYELSEVKEGRYYVLKRLKNYWADKLPSHRGMYNFDVIKYKIIRDDNVAFEAFKKGDFDIFTDITAKRYVTETATEPFQKYWIVKQRIYNNSPQGFQGLALNMRKPMFQDLKVRKALNMLLDRKTLINKIMFDMYEPLSSYWPSLYAFGEGNPAINYDPVKAKELLKEAGYKTLDKEGYLVNGKGQRLEFSVSYANGSLEKHLTFFVENCKNAGVKVNLELLSWATLLKKMEEFKYDTVSIGWSASLFEDPEQLWHSRHADEAGGSDLPGYKNPVVDKLIDSLPPIFDALERKDIIRKIDSIVYKDYPYILFWGANFQKVFYKNIFGTPPTVLSRYGSLSEALVYWWYDESKGNAYKAAMKNKSALPLVPESVTNTKNPQKKD